MSTPVHSVNITAMFCQAETVRVRGKETGRGVQTGGEGPHGAAVQDEETAEGDPGDHLLPTRLGEPHSSGPDVQVSSTH